MENSGNHETNDDNIIITEEMEDMGLLKMMMEVDRNEKATREEVMKKLS